MVRAFESLDQTLPEAVYFQLCEPIFIVMMKIILHDIM